MITTEFGDIIAERIRAEHQVLAARWFERLVDLLPVDARDVFPSESLLDHIPALILEIGSYLRQPDREAIAANTEILGKARELGALRHAQQASLHQLLREYQVLSGVLVTFVLEEIDRLGIVPEPSAAVTLVSRLHQAVDVLSQATVEAFVTLYTQTIAEQSDRLEQFTRMAAHEWRQPLGALQFGVSLLRRPEFTQERRDRTLDVVERNVARLINLTHTLETVARMRQGTDNPVVQQVSAATVAAEAARQLREMADTRGVEVRVDQSLPTLTVDVGRLELTLLNLLSNGIKYSDPAKSERYVEVSADGSAADHCTILVRDNGIGIPTGALETIFARFTRVYHERQDLNGVDGIGLGLSIVEDCVRAMGGRVEVESTEGTGTLFTLTLPRQGERASAIEE
jgi:signal transduction histidine kinase